MSQFQAVKLINGEVLEGDVAVVRNADSYSIPITSLMTVTAGSYIRHIPWHAVLYLIERDSRLKPRLTGSDVGA